jgi:hypothetical protein
MVPRAYRMRQDRLEVWLRQPYKSHLDANKSSATIIEYLHSSLSQDTNYIAGYYFNATEDEKRNVARLIRSLLLQLLPTEGELSPHVKKLCNNTSQNVSESQLLLALGELIDREEHTYIVIDALDECDASFQSGEDSEVEKLDSFLQWLLQKSRNLHLLVTSRDGGLASTLEKRLRNMVKDGQKDSLVHEFDLQSVKMKAEIENDIGKLVNSELKRWNGLEGRRRWLPLNKDQQNLVADSVKEKANGM